MTRQKESMRVTPLGFCLRVIVNEKPLNLEKTTSSYLSVLSLIYGVTNFQWKSLLAIFNSIWLFCKRFNINRDSGASKILCLCYLEGWTVQVYAVKHSCMPSPLAPDPIRVQSCVCCLFWTNRNCMASTSIFLSISLSN